MYEINVLNIICEGLFSYPNKVIQAGVLFGQAKKNKHSMRSIQINLLISLKMHPTHVSVSHHHPMHLAHTYSNSGRLQAPSK